MRRRSRRPVPRARAARRSAGGAVAAPAAARAGGLQPASRGSRRWRGPVVACAGCSTGATEGHRTAGGKRSGPPRRAARSRSLIWPAAPRGLLLRPLVFVGTADGVSVPAARCPASRLTCASTARGNAAARSRRRRPTPAAAPRDSSVETREKLRNHNASRDRHLLQWPRPASASSGSSSSSSSSSRP